MRSRPCKPLHVRPFAEFCVVFFACCDVRGRLPFVFSAENATFLKVDNEFEDSGDNARGKRQIHLTTL